MTTETPKVAQALLVGCVLSFALGAGAATYNVPADYASLADAMAVATNAGDVVVLAAQTHTLTNRVTVKKGVTLRGATASWKDTIVSGDGKYQGLNLAEGAVVSNLTVKSCDSNGATVGKNARMENCRVTDCKRTAQASGHPAALGVYVNAGTLTRCVIDGNRVTAATDKWSSAAGLMTAGNATVSYVTITNNCIAKQATSDGWWSGYGAVCAGASTFDHCYIGDNHVYAFTAPRDGYATAVNCTGAAIFKNCTIVENTWGSPVLNNIYGVTGHASAKFTDTIIYGNGQEDGGFNDAALDAVKAANVSGLALGKANATTMALADEVATADDFVRIGGKLTVKYSSAFATYGSEPAWNGEDPVDPEPAGTTYYVDAVADLQTTISGAKAGDTVVIRKGTYPLTAAISITTPGVTVRGETGKYGDVVLDGQNAVQCVAISGWRARLEGVTLLHGRANGAGAGISVGLGAVVKNCRVADITYPSGYSAYTEGMGIYCDGGKLLDTILENVVCQRSTHRTVGLYLTGGGEFNRGTIRNCSATSSARNDGYYTPNIGFKADNGTVANSVICGNSQGAAGSGSVSSALGGSLGTYSRAINCLVYDNTYNGSDTSIASYGLLGGYVYNCVVLENGPLDATRDGHNYVASTASRSNNYTDQATAEGSTASLYGTLADALVVEGDYWKVRKGSALIDAGAAQFALAQGNDFWQTNRLEGAAIDIGPFEYHLPALAVAVEAPVTRGLDRIDTTVTATADGDTTGIGYAWYLDDEAEPFAAGGAEKASVPVSLVGWGTYVVKVTVTNAAAATASASISFTITQGKLYVTTNVNAHAVIPYDTPEKAATNITDALALATEGASVYLLPGTYKVTSPISITNAITVRGSGAREESIVSGGGTSRLFTLTARGATLANLTLSDGYASTYHGVAPGIALADGTWITNCVVRNFTDGNVGVGGAVRNNNGTIVDSVISNCVGYSHGIAYYQTGNDSRAERVLVCNNRHLGTYGGDGYNQISIVHQTSGEIRNSMILDNVASPSSWSTASMHASGCAASGVYMEGGKLVNCTVSGNSFTIPQAYSNYFTHAGAVFAGGKVVNCLIAGNTGSDPELADVVHFSGTNNLTTCCTYPFDSLPAGNVSSIDGGRVWRRFDDGTVRLTHSSPAIDAGTHQDWMDDGVDYLRRPRILNQEVDIGAVEVLRTGLMLLVK